MRDLASPAPHTSAPSMSASSRLVRFDAIRCASVAGNARRMAHFLDATVGQLVARQVLVAIGLRPACVRRSEALASCSTDMSFRSAPPPDLLTSRRLHVPFY